MSYPFILQGDNVTLVIDSEPHTINKTHISYQKVVEAIKAGDWDSVKALINPAKAVMAFSKGNVSIVDGEMFWKGQPFHNSLANRMIQMFSEGFDIEPMTRFMENLMRNPSNRAIRELYAFLEKSNLPITPDGCFLGYKNVRENYTDIHSGLVPNKPASLLSATERAAYPITTKNGVTVNIINGETVVTMERNEVDDNREVTCSNGLHVCSQGYLKNFNSVNGHTLIVKVDPSDVVSVPSDHNDQKLRSCKYVVIGEVNTNEMNEPKAFTKAVQNNANNVMNAPKQEPKFGSSAFYKGYTDGFENNEYDDGDYWNKDEVSYGEGYSKGENHREAGLPECYRYVKRIHTEVKTGTWPMPK